MRIGLKIVDFESSYTTSFQHTARVKYGVDFDTSVVNDIKVKLGELKHKVELSQSNNVHVGFEITLEYVIHVQHLLNQIIEKYIETFHFLPPNTKVYTILRKLKEAESPTVKELAKEVLVEIINPETSGKPTKSQKLADAADAMSKRRALKTINKLSSKKK